jgi:hypothetical protein
MLKPTNHRFSLILDRRLFDRLARAAAEDRRSITNLINIILEQWVSREEKKGGN